MADGTIQPMIVVCPTYNNTDVYKRQDYVTNDDSMSRPFDAPPFIVNYFYHEQIKKKTKRGRAFGSVAERTRCV